MQEQIRRVIKCPIMTEKNTPSKKQNQKKKKRKKRKKKNIYNCLAHNMFLEIHIF